MKPSSELQVRQMPALPIMRAGDGVEGEEGRRTMTKSRTPLVGEASIFWRMVLVWWMLVEGAHDLRVFFGG